VQNPKLRYFKPFEIFDHRETNSIGLTDNRNTLRANIPWTGLVLNRPLSENGTTFLGFVCS
jgi:hypothetical protein